MIKEIDTYKIEIFSDDTFTSNSTDNVNSYDYVYFDKSEYIFPSMYGIKVFQFDELICSAIIGSIGGGTAIHENSVIIDENKIIICCSDSIFCLSIPDLKLLWKTQADTATCFQIFKHKDGYIVHGELEITKIKNDGKILWQQSGSDIFTTEDGIDDFKITEEYILATDWRKKKYKFDFEGKLMN